jgi:hypothetical protein
MMLYVPAPPSGSDSPPATAGFDNRPTAPDEEAGTRAEDEGRKEPRRSRGLKASEPVPHSRSPKPPAARQPNRVERPVGQVRSPPPWSNHRSNSERLAISADPSRWTGMRRAEASA